MGREEHVDLLISLPQSRRPTRDAVKLPFTDTAVDLCKSVGGSRPQAVFDRDYFVPFKQSFLASGLRGGAAQIEWLAPAWRRDS